MTRETPDPAFYAAHKDDPELWGEPEEPPQPPRRANLAATITVRFTPEEADAIRRLAREAGLTYSEVVRKAVQAFTQPRYTMQHGTIYPPFPQPSDIRREAEQVVETTLQSQGDTMTHSRSLPLPARR